MKNIVLICNLLLWFFSIQAQSKVELKADVLGVFESAIGLSGEYLLSPRWGIEVGGGYQAYKYIDDAFKAQIRSVHGDISSSA